MKIFSLTLYALSLPAAAALMAGCSNGVSSVGASSGMTPNGFQSPRTISINGMLITAAHPNFGVRNHRVPMAPDKNNKKKALYQYAATFGEGPSLLVFDYPKSDKQIGSIGDISEVQGECANVLFGAGKKSFWVTASGNDQIDEFKVGGSNPIKTLSAPSGDVPVGCAMDPASGNLAATIINTGAVVIYTKASGSGTVSQSPLVEAFFAGYDKGSNLYVDGFNSEGTFGFVELKKGSSTWETLSTTNSVEFPGQVQFDGKYITVNDQEAHDIFGYTCQGTSCTLKRTVSLTGSSDCDQTWIGNRVVFCPDAGNLDVEVYKYPAGGSPIAILTGTAGYVELLAIVQARR
ncbi:MAG: hypothetical protein WA431_03770 [Candidatus Cybelea sp.]